MYESVHSTDYKLLFETFGTNVFPGIKKLLTTKKKCRDLRSAFFTYLRVPLALSEHALVDNI